MPRLYCRNGREDRQRRNRGCVLPPPPVAARNSLRDCEECRLRRRRGLSAEDIAKIPANAGNGSETDRRAVASDLRAMRTAHGRCDRAASQHEENNG